MEKQYQLPEVEELKEIGFKFKHKTIQDTINYINEFVKNNRSEVMEIIIPGFDGEVYEERLNSINIFTYKESAEIIERISRIKRGFIVKRDYLFVVHPKHKDNKDILFKTWTNRLKKYSVDSQLAMYDQSFLGINDDEAIDLVFYNELLRFIICKLQSDEFNEENDSLSEINEQIRNMRDKLGYYQQNGSFLLYRACELNCEKLIHAKYELLFSMSETIAQKATRLFKKIQEFDDPRKVIECTSVTEKEIVLRHYLKKQTVEVVKSKNTRSKGVNKSKKRKIIHYISKNPDTNNTEIAKVLGVNRKTVRKYRIL